MDDSNPMKGEFYSSNELRNVPSEVWTMYLNHDTQQMPPMFYPLNYRSKKKLHIVFLGSNQTH